MSNPDDQKGGGSTQVPPRAGKRRPSSSVPPRGGKGRPQAVRGPRGRQARQAAQRRNRMLAVVAVVAAVVVVVVLVLVGITGSSGGSPRQPAPAAAVATIKNVPLSTMVAATKKITSLNPAVEASGGSLTKDGKPTLLFIGAEFCPICAAQRWPMTMALSKFGTFTNLKQTHSALTDGNIGTWSYYGSTYTSQYLNFDPNELYTNQVSGNYYKPLETLSAKNQSIWSANEGSNEAFPFVYFNGKMVLETSQFDPTSVQYKSFESILSTVGSNDNTVGAEIDASAAVFTKYLCQMTGNQPGDVCSAVANVSAPVASSSSGPSSSASG